MLFFCSLNLSWDVRRCPGHERHFGGECLDYVQLSFFQDYVGFMCGGVVEIKSFVAHGLYPALPRPLNLITPEANASERCSPTAQQPGYCISITT